MPWPKIRQFLQHNCYFSSVRAGFQCSDYFVSMDAYCSPFDCLETLENGLLYLRSQLFLDGPVRVYIEQASLINNSAHPIQCLYLSKGDSRQNHTRTLNM